MIPVLASSDRRQGAWRRRITCGLLILGSGGLVGGSAFAAASLGRTAQGTQSDSLDVLLLRTWRPDDLTIVDGLANVPLDMLAGGTTGTYRFDLTIFDASGNSLYRDSWERRLSQRAASFAETSATELLETFQFGVMPGTYDVEIRAYPTDAPDLGVRARIPLQAFDEKPETSDLILASRVEPITEGAGGGSWSITHGGVGISAAARTAVLAQEPDLYYYIELYGTESRRTVDAHAEIQSGERVIFRTSSASVDVPPEGLPFSGHVPLTGLPPGDYQLAIVLEGESTTRDVADFTMLAPASSAAAAAGQPSEEERYFASLSESELEETFGGITVLVTDSERRLYEALPSSAKRSYLATFFAGRDPSPGSGGNEFLDEYIERIGVIRSRWGSNVGVRELMPWIVPMGRFYLKYGEPDDRVINYNPTNEGQPAVTGAGVGGEPPYEIWRFSSTGFVYLFIDENQTNVWRLAYSSDPDVTSMPDWARRVGSQAIRDLQAFGVNPRGI